MTWADVITHSVNALNIEYKIALDATAFTILGLHNSCGLPLINPTKPSPGGRLLQVVPQGMLILNLIKT